MSLARIRLFVTAALFVGWLGWLGYLAANKTNPAIVSRSQVMAATHFVVARVAFDPETGVPSKDVTVVEDLRPVGKPLFNSLRVTNLNDAQIAGGHRYEDRGEYLLLLERDPLGDGEWKLVVPPERRGRTDKAPARPWAYRWDDPELKRQFNALVPKP